MKWHRDKWGHIIDENGKEVRFRSVSILSSSSDERINEAERNTDLICAAPALLEALEETVSDLWQQIEGRHGPKIASEYPSIVKAKAAIKQAKGEV